MALQHVAFLAGKRTRGWDLAFLERTLRDAVAMGLGNPNVR
jgi:hypothetical protein